MLVPPRPRVQIEDKGYELRLEIPPRRDAATIGQWAFLTFWLGGWAMGEFFAGSLVLRTVLPSLAGVGPVIGEQPATSHGPGGPSLLFIVFWLCGWTVGGVLAIHHWLHLMWGRELIAVDSNKLVILSLPLARRREYLAPEVSDMRVSTAALERTRQWRTATRHTGGGISFIYGGQEHNFGATLDPSEAETVISAIGRRYKWMVERNTQED
ncbi:MAG: hypothetical protein KKI08_24085 [Armatimonadetes bacterium]|nr:hypothetical protein [Armatimonadota bacterium]